MAERNRMNAFAILCFVSFGRLLLVGILPGRSLFDSDQISLERRESSVSHALLDSVTDHFADLDDPRRETANRRHEFGDILMIALCAVIGGANHWTRVERFGRAKEGWFRTFLSLPNGIPSHDTFSDVFAKLDPEQFETCFIEWVSAMASRLPEDVVAVDGKAMRRSHDRGRGGERRATLVSAWSTANALVLGQRGVRGEVQRDHGHPGPAGNGTRITTSV